MTKDSKKPHTIIDVEVGKKIRSRRRVVGESQSTLANAVGITFQQIQKYETGTNTVTASRLHAISAALGVPASYFFESVATRPREGRARRPAEEAAIMLASSEGIELNRAFIAITNVNVRRSLIALIRAIAQHDEE